MTNTSSIVALQRGAVIQELVPPLIARVPRADSPVEKLVIVADPDDVAIGIYRALGFVEAEQQVGLDRG